MSTDTSAAAGKIMKLRSSDGELFQIGEKAAVQSNTLKNLIENSCGDTAMPIRVTGKNLAKVIEYCKHHAEANEEDEAAMNALETFDAEFVKVDEEQLYDLMEAADYLNIKGLLELTSLTLADMIEGEQLEETPNVSDIAYGYPRAVRVHYNPTSPACSPYRYWWCRSRSL